MRPQEGDILVKSRSTDITVIWGNESDTVKQNTFPLNDNGFVNSTDGEDSHFAIVRINIMKNQLFLMN